MRRTLYESLKGGKIREEATLESVRKSAGLGERKAGQRHKAPNYVSRKDDHNYEFTREEIQQMKTNMELQDNRNHYKSVWR